jgi:hypothetical protein
MQPRQYPQTRDVPSTGSAPTATDLHSAMVALANGSITVEGLRVVMRRSRALNGAELHDRLKAEAVAHLVR